MGAADGAALMMRASSCLLRSSVIESPELIILCEAIFFIGFFAVGVAAAAFGAAGALAGAAAFGAAGAAFGGDDGVIGAVCAQTRAAIARAAAMATPVKRCFMLFVLFGNFGFGNYAA